jgi:hypothetical protein
MTAGEEVSTIFLYSCFSGPQNNVYLEAPKTAGQLTRRPWSTVSNLISLGGGGAAVDSNPPFGPLQETRPSVAAHKVDIQRSVTPLFLVLEINGTFE